MNLLILLTFIFSSHLSIAASCSASEDAGSLDNLFTFANDSFAVTDELDNNFPLSKIDIMKICFKTDMSKNAEKNPYKVFKEELEKALIKKEIPFDDIEVYLSDNLSKIQCLTRSTIKIRNKSSIFKHAINSKNYALIEQAIFKVVNGKSVCNHNINFNQVEAIDGKDETLIDFIDKVLADSELDGIYHFPSIRTIRAMVHNCKG